MRMVTIISSFWYLYDNRIRIRKSNKTFLLTIPSNRIRICKSNKLKWIHVWSINRGILITTGINCNWYFAVKTSERCQSIRLPAGWPVTTGCFNGSLTSLTWLPSMYFTLTYCKTSSNFHWPNWPLGDPWHQSHLCHGRLYCGTVW